MRLGGKAVGNCLGKNLERLGVMFTEESGPHIQVPFDVSGSTLTLFIPEEK